MTASIIGLRVDEVRIEFVTTTLIPCILVMQMAAEDNTGVIEWQPDRPLLVRSVLPTDCRVVRGFTHGLVDGREDTRYSNGVVGEWTGLS